MSAISAVPNILHPDHKQPDPWLAASITRAASRQTYYIVRFLVDRDRILDAYRAYGYFRWVDDHLDQGGLDRAERIAFVERQQALVSRCYRRERIHHLTDEETMLVDLIRGDHEINSGLQSYIRNMMAVMAFDAGRRSQLVSQAELTRYTHWLAVAVTEALHDFIGHGSKSPRRETRYLAATAAHITHMLRDALEDAEMGYFNIPREYIESHGIDPRDVRSDPYRRWVRSQVQLAKRYFEAGRDYLAQVENPRCRLAGYAYIARFDGVLETIERDGYLLRAGYPECKSPRAALRMAGSVLALAFSHRHPASEVRALSAR